MKFIKIPRKYEWLGCLYENDPLAREAIDRAYTINKVHKQLKEETLQYNRYHIPAFLNIGCGIPGDCYAHFMAEFKKLDEANPYDNRLTFKDVTAIEFEPSYSGKAIQMRLIQETSELPYRIVGFVSVREKGKKIIIDKGWEMMPAYEIG